MRRMVTGLIAMVLLVGICSNKAYATNSFDEVWDEYYEDEQFQMMLEDYGEEYAVEFINNVIANRSSVSVSRGGGGNECYQYVTNIMQTKTYNCGSTTVLQSLYGMGAQGNLSGSTDAAKIETLDTQYNVDSQGSLYVYQVVDALNTYKPSGIGSYVYQTGSSVSQDTFESNIATSLTYCRPIVLHAKTEYLTYYGGKSSGHYLSLDYINRTTDLVRIVDCNYNSAYYGIHTSVPLSEAYASISASGRYYIY